MERASAEQVVHETRKKIKRARAALALVRPAIGRKAQRREDRRLRQAARALSASREVGVHARLIADLIRRSGVGSEEPFRTARRHFQRRAELAERLLRSDRRPLRDAAQALDRAARVTPPVRDVPPRRLRKGLERLYRRARRALRRARRSGEPEDFHTARKRAMSLRFALERLAEGAGNGYAELAETLHELTDALGEAHDRRTLQDVLRRESGAVGGTPTVDWFLRWIDRDAEEIERRALALGREIFRGKRPDV